VNTVAPNIDNIDTVADDINSVVIVAGSIADVNTTAGNIGNVNLVGSDLSNEYIFIEDCGSITDPVQATEGESLIRTVAENITNVNLVAENIVAVQGAVPAAEQAALDAIATAADRTQTGLDVQATGGHVTLSQQAAIASAASAAALPLVVTAMAADLIRTQEIIATHHAFE